MRQNHTWLTITTKKIQPITQIIFKVTIYHFSAINVECLLAKNKGNMASTLILVENLLEPELRVCICINVPLIKKCTEITKG